MRISSVVVVRTSRRAGFAGYLVGRGSGLLTLATSPLISRAARPSETLRRHRRRPRCAAPCEPVGSCATRRRERRRPAHISSARDGGGAGRGASILVRTARWRTSWSAIAAPAMARARLHPEEAGHIVGGAPRAGACGSRQGDRRGASFEFSASSAEDAVRMRRHLRRQGYRGPGELRRYGHAVPYSGESRTLVCAMLIWAAVGGGVGYAYFRKFRDV